jgi:hypothetical protein
MKSLAKDFEYSREDIIIANQTWANYNGFSGETCGVCGATANVLAGGAGWFCVCGQYNAQSLSCFRLPHDSPTYGPDGETIANAHTECATLCIGDRARGGAFVYGAHTKLSANLGEIGIIVDISEDGCRVSIRFDDGYVESHSKYSVKKIFDFMERG